MSRLHRLSFLGYCLGLSTCFAQRTDSASSTLVHAELGSYVTSHATMPFWLRANQYAIVPLSGSIGTVRLGVRSDYRPLVTNSRTGNRRRFDWGYGAEVVANGGAVNQLILPEAYVKVRYGAVEFYAGRRRGITGLVDTSLTSGAYSWSGNALPMPKIQIGTIGYAPLGFTKGLLAINAFFNHGWFNKGFVQHSYLHQKALYLRVGKPDWRVKFYAGGNHEVQWGGYAPGLIGVPGVSDNLDGQFASNLDAYFRVVSTASGTGYVPNQGVISIDQGNRIGNHLGSLDVGVEFAIGGWQLMAYRQNLYETGALYYFTNIADGLNGLRIQRRQPANKGFSVNHVLLEFFYSKSQGGPEFVILDPKRRGRNNYFNHSQFQDGWTYLGRTIGTPFLTPEAEVSPGLGKRAVVNNRVSLLHLAASGTAGSGIQWLAKLSYSQNFGTYDEPFSNQLNQFSGLVTASAPVTLPAIGSCLLNVSLAVDQGQLLTNTTGLYVGLRKTVSTRPQSLPIKPTPARRMLRQ